MKRKPLPRRTLVNEYQIDSTEKQRGPTLNFQVPYELKHEINIISKNTPSSGLKVAGDHIMIQTTCEKPYI